MKPRTFALLGATAALFLFSFLWFIPAAQSPGYDIVMFGEERTFRWTAQSSHYGNAVWEHDLVLPSGNTDVIPSIHVIAEGIEDRYGLFVIHIKQTANGQVIYERYMGLSAAGGYEERTPLRQEVNGDYWVKGTNHIRVEIEVKFSSKTPSDQSFFATIGPVMTFVYDSDSEHDGVPDSEQLVKGVHSGLVAAALTLFVVAALYVVHRRRKGGAQVR